VPQAWISPVIPGLVLAAATAPQRTVRRTLSREKRQRTEAGGQALEAW
jgi:hypothetical protein